MEEGKTTPRDHYSKTLKIVLRKEIDKAGYRYKVITELQ